MCAAQHSTDPRSTHAALHPSSATLHPLTRAEQPPLRVRPHQGLSGRATEPVRHEVTAAYTGKAGIGHDLEAT